MTPPAGGVVVGCSDGGTESFRRRRVGHQVREGRVGLLEQLPTLVIHGSEDPMISVDMARQSRDALAELGVPATYREYEMGHEINQDALRELVGWLDQKVMNPILLA